jgi:hypothetical protein
MSTVPPVALNSQIKSTLLAHVVDLVQTSPPNRMETVPDKSVVKLNIGDRIKLTSAQFERLAKAFFAEMESKFL